jgi:hypothetical protein
MATITTAAMTIRHDNDNHHDGDNDDDDNKRKVTTSRCVREAQ